MSCTTPPADGFCSLTIYDDTSSWESADVDFKQGAGPTPATASLIWRNRALEYHRASMLVQFADNGDVKFTKPVVVKDTYGITSDGAVNLTGGESDQSIVKFCVGQSSAVRLQVTQDGQLMWPNGSYPPTIESSSAELLGVLHIEGALDPAYFIFKLVNNNPVLELRTVQPYPKYWQLRSSSSSIFIIRNATDSIDCLKLVFQGDLQTTGDMRAGRFVKVKSGTAEPGAADGVRGSLYVRTSNQHLYAKVGTQTWKSVATQALP